MLLQNILYRKNQNTLQDAGDLDGQILSDLEALRKNLQGYQEEHLDKKVRGHSNHYEEWSAENGKKLEWLDRLIQAARMGMKCTYPAPGTLTREAWYTMRTEFRQPCVLGMAARETGHIRTYLPETVYVERQSLHPDDWYLWSVAACREEPGSRVWDCWTLNLTTGSMNGGHYGLSLDGLKTALAAKKGARVCGPGEYPEKIKDQEEHAND